MNDEQIKAELADLENQHRDALERYNQLGQMRDAQFVVVAKIEGTMEWLRALASRPPPLTVVPDAPLDGTG